MKHSYKLRGMMCNSCKVKVEKALNEINGITQAVVTLPDGVILEMETHIDLHTLQDTLSTVGAYTIELEHHTNKVPDDTKISADCCGANTHTQIHDNTHIDTTAVLSANTGVKYYCPMYCEGDKVYDHPGDCPVCGMDLIKQPDLSQSTEYTCPMHPQIVRDTPGSCPICGMDLVPKEPNESEEKKNFKRLLQKMIRAVILSVPVFIISMGDLLPGNPLGTIMSQQYRNWIQLILTTPIVFYVCWMFFVRAWKSIISWNLNMFTLVGIGTGVAYVFSVVGIFVPEIFPQEFITESGSVHLYFEATAVILSLVLLGQVLEARAHSQTSGAIKKLLQLAPSEAILVESSGDRVVSIHDIEVGNLLRVKPGDKIPVDGKITEGNSSIDESMISGEPIPVDKEEGDKVTSGTINGNKSFVMIAERVGADTLLSQIIQMVDEASHSRAPIQKLVDTVAKYFVPLVIVIAVITFIVWVMFGPEPAYTYAFVNAIAVLIIACPCALGLATPMSVMVGVGKGAQSGILIKNAQALETMNKVDVLITDKTGTLTQGKPTVEKIYVVNGSNEKDLLQKIASLNQYSEHPLAQAVVKYGKAKDVQLIDVNDFEGVTGKGVIGTIEGTKVALGNIKLMEQMNIAVSDELTTKVIIEQKLGKTVSYISVGEKAVGFVAISDAIKETSKKAITQLISMGVEVIMMTGDNINTAKAVANELNLSDFRAGCLSEDKLNMIKDLQAKGKIVAMAGDGINDSPALAQADVGIAMGTGTDVAIESSEITLIKGDLQGIVKVKNLSHKVMINIKQNLFFAFIYNILGIPIAAGLFYPAFGLLLSPMIAAAAMSFSSVSVIMNALRLRKLKL